MSHESWAITPKFKTGDRVTIDDRSFEGHCRAPQYLRGLTAEVAEVHGPFRDPERLAYHKPGLPPQVLYKLRLLQTAIWPDYTGPASDTLEVDIYENWLTAAA